jgi:hypothetical protein
MYEGRRMPRDIIYEYGLFLNLSSILAHANPIPRPNIEDDMKILKIEPILSKTEVSGSIINLINDIENIMHTGSEIMDSIVNNILD